MKEKVSTIEWRTPVTQEQYERLYGIHPWGPEDWIACVLGGLFVMGMLYFLWSAIAWLIGGKQEAAKEVEEAPSAEGLAEQEKAERRELRKLQRQRRRELNHDPGGEG